MIVAVLMAAATTRAVSRPLAGSNLMPFAMTPMKIVAVIVSLLMLTLSVVPVLAHVIPKSDALDRLEFAHLTPQLLMARIATTDLNVLVDSVPHGTCSARL